MKRTLESHLTPRNSKLLVSNRMFARIQRRICLAESNLSVCHLRRCPVGGYRCKRAHWRGALPTCPPASLTTVCCTMWSPRCSRQNNPHSYTHESVHLAPHAHIKPPEPYRHGDTGTPLQSCCCGINRYSTVSYRCTSSILSTERPEPRWCTAESHLAVTER